MELCCAPFTEETEWFWQDVQSEEVNEKKKAGCLLSPGICSSISIIK